MLPCANGAPVDKEFGWDIERAIGELHRAIAELSLDHETNLSVFAYHELANAYQTNNGVISSGIYDRLALYYARKAAELADKESDIELWAKVRNTYASLLAANLTSPYSARDPAIKILEETLEGIRHLKGSDIWCAVIYNLGTAYIHRHNGDQEVNRARAIEYLEMLEAVEPEQANPSRWAQTQYALGKVRVVQSDYRRAIDHFERALSARGQIAESIATVELGSLYRAMASSYEAIGDTAHSDEFYNKAMALYHDESIMWALTRSQYADALSRRDPVVAAQLYRESLDVFSRVDFAGEYTGYAAWGTCPAGAYTIREG